MGDLYSLARTSKYYETFVGDIIIKRKFAMKMVIFDTLLLSDSPKFITEETSEYIMVNDVQTAKKLLKQFGQYIQHLNFVNVPAKNNLNLVRYKEIYELIQQHCSETLTGLHYRIMKNVFFEFITKPFANVQTISFSSTIIDLKNENLNFQQMFPALRNLHLNLISIQNTSTICLNYPHLNHLHVEYENQFFTTQLIEKNPQIRSLVLKNCYSQLLKVVSENLVNLEQLTLSDYIEPRSNIQFQFHFENVKRFKMSNSKDPSIPSNITFGKHLEELDISVRSSDHSYIDFIENNKNLKKIRIDATLALNKNDIDRLAAANLDVVEMSLTCKLDIKDSFFYQILIENCKQLEQLNLIMVPYGTSVIHFVDTLSSRLGNEWTFNVKQNTIFIVRKDRMLFH